MKYLFPILLSVLLFACDNPGQSNRKTEKTNSTELNTEGIYGVSISNNQAADAMQLSELLTDEPAKELKLSGKIKSSCKMSGCWMDVGIGDGKTVHVTFENEGFTIPLDAAGKSVIMEGVATKEMISVDYLKRQAKSEGKTQEEIDAITKPEVEYSFVASGVIIK